VDALVEKMFTGLMADSAWDEVDRPTFITTAKEFLTAIASNLEVRASLAGMDATKIHY